MSELSTSKLEHCPTCGAPVIVQGEEEGTHSYQPVTLEACQCVQGRIIIQLQKGREALLRSIDDLSGRLSDAAAVIMAVRDWDNAGRDTGTETSRLLHNAYVDWDKAIAARDQAIKDQKIKEAKEQHGR